MNRLPDPIVARTLSGDALSPCPNGSVSDQGTLRESRDPAGSESAPPLEAPADLPLAGLQKTLADFTITAAALTSTLADIQFRKPQDPISLCHWLDWIRERADEITSHGMALHQMTAYLGDRAHAECMKRYRAIADAAERESPIQHFDPREPEPFREPIPCTMCGGHGGSVSEGDCDHCQGTCIDPSDPASPL